MPSTRTRRLALPLGIALCLPLLETPAQSAAEKALKSLESEFAAARDAYLAQLGAWLPEAYREHLANLSDQDLATVAATRRLWQWYIAEGPHPMGDPRKQRTGIFRQEFLEPMDRMAEILLIDPEEIRDKDVRRARRNAFELAEKLLRKQKRAGVDLDPTKGKTSPTGLAYPHLDRPPTCVDNLRLFERTIVLAKTVAPPEAEPILLENAEACAEIDLEEANFAMYGNQVRMLSGSIAWVVDPLMAACTRDFSNDKAEGKGSGHQSEVPGKRFPRDRARRFGCRNGPEGAGGGRDGVQSIRGFAYNGTGHGGPLFAQLRNVVAPGYRGGAFTAMYTTDERLRHPCQASQNELVLPPGITSRELSGSNRAAFRAMQQGAFKTAWNRLEGKPPKDPLERAVRRYLIARLHAEADWTLTGIERILDAGDAFEAHRRLASAQKAMDGVPGFDRRAALASRRLEQRGVADEITVGRIYHQLTGQEVANRAGLTQLIEKHPESHYAGAAQHYLEASKNGNAFWPERFYFVLRDTHLNKWSYLDPESRGG